MPLSASPPHPQHPALTSAVTHTATINSQTYLWSKHAGTDCPRLRIPPPRPTGLKHHQADPTASTQTLEPHTDSYSSFPKEHLSPSHPPLSSLCKSSPQGHLPPPSFPTLQLQGHTPDRGTNGVTHTAHCNACPPPASLFVSPVIC